MEISVLKNFFGWSSLFYLSFFLVSVVGLMAFRNFQGRFHAKWFGLTESEVHAVSYLYLGLFKLAFLALGLIPYLALCAMESMG